MAFTGLKLTETDTDEIARLADAPEGSRNRLLSELPITNPRPATHQILEFDSRLFTGHRMVVVPIERVNDRPVTLPHSHDASWRCRVVAGNHPSYLPGGYDIISSTSELRRARIVEV